jgi:phosphate/sulfate permease
MLAASSSVVAFLIQNVAIAHLKEAEGKTGRRLRAIGIGMVVAALVSFAVGITVAANAMGNLVGSLDAIAQR